MSQSQNNELVTKAQMDLIERCIMDDNLSIRFAVSKVIGKYKEAHAHYIKKNHTDAYERIMRVKKYYNILKYEKRGWVVGFKPVTVSRLIQVTSEYWIKKITKEQLDYFIKWADEAYVYKDESSNEYLAEAFRGYVAGCCFTMGDEG